MNEYLLLNQVGNPTLLLVAAKKKASGRGGWRPGSGRKAILKDPARITIDMERTDLEALSALADAKGVSTAQMIRNAVSTLLRRHRSRD